MTVIKKYKNIALYGLILLFSWTILGLSSGSQKRRPCNELRISLKNDLENHFLDLSSVKNLVREEYGSPIEGTALGQISVASIEYSLRKNPYIKSAEVFKDVSGNLVADVTLRKPIARVIASDGGGFYLDQDFHKVPLSSNFSANTLLIRGNISEKFQPADTLKDARIMALKPLLEYINKDDFLRSQVAELVLNRKGEVLIYPEVGDIEIEFGKPDRIEEKFNNLMLFYKEVLNRTGWDEYTGISLKFKGQVVGRKN